MRPLRELVVMLALAGCASSALPGSIGVVARREAATGRVVVVDVPPGSAGARAGLETGDEILTIDGRRVGDLSRDELRGVMRGPVGSKALVEVKRNGLVQQIVVERVEIRVKDGGA